MSREKLFDDLFGDRPKHELGKHTPENEKFKKENLPAKYSKPEAQKKLKKAFNKLRHKAIYLNMENEELIEEFEYIRREFIAEMLKYCDSKKINTPFESVPDNKDKSTAISDDEMNNLFREVVKKTHPDLNANLPAEDLEEKIELYHEAIEGKQSGDFRKVLQVALELNIKIKNISPEFIAQLKKEIQKMQKNMKQIKNDIMYKWAKSDKKTKQQIFELLTKNLKAL